MPERHVTQPPAGSATIQDWPAESRDAAQLVIDRYGEPHEVTPSILMWTNAGPWKRLVATRVFYHHAFPAPHIDCVESFIDYHVPPDLFTPLAEFDGSVIVERTAGEVSASCHDVEANFLALNLMNDIVQGNKTVQQARDYYAEEFLNARRNRPTPYMDRLGFEPQPGTSTDPDQRVVSDDQLEAATGSS